MLQRDDLKKLKNCSYYIALKHIFYPLKLFCLKFMDRRLKIHIGQIVIQSRLSFLK